MLRILVQLDNLTGGWLFAWKTLLKFFSLINLMSLVAILVLHLDSTVSSGGGPLPDLKKDKKAKHK